MKEIVAVALNGPPNTQPQPHAKVERERQDKNKKTEQKRKELMDFVARFSANAAKSKQATSRKKALEKLQLDRIKISSRKYPFIRFNPERKAGGNILEVENLSKRSPNGEMLFSNVSFEMNRDEKIILMSHEATAITAFFQVLMGQLEPDSGTFKFGQSITYDDLPLDNSSYFSGDNDLDLINWLRQYSGNSDEEKDEQFIRGFFGRMLFKGDEVLKNVSVLSGGEKVRCMLSKMMLRHPNMLLLDEPTNHLDLESITALDTALTEFKGNIIMSSHDHKLCQTIGNRIIEITPNGVIDSLLDFDDYLTSERILNMRRELYGAENVR